MTWSVGDDITAQKLNLFSLVTDVSAITGSNWDGTSPITEYSGRQTVTVGVSAVFTVTLPVAFAHGLLFAALWPGDGTASSGTLGFVVPRLSNHTLSSLQASAFTQAAAGVSNGVTCVVDYRAIGW